VAPGQTTINPARYFCASSGNRSVKSNGIKRHNTQTHMYAPRSIKA
jgi:hypothetical protein